MELVRLSDYWGRTLSETKASRIDATVPNLWYLVSSGGQATIRISEGLSLGLDDHGGLLLSPPDAESRLVEFELEPDGVWLRVVSPAWGLARGERGLPVRIKLDHLMGLQLPGHHFQVRSGLSAGDDADLIEVSLIPQLAVEPVAEPVAEPVTESVTESVTEHRRHTTSAVPRNASVAFSAATGEVRSAAAASARQPTPVRTIITVPEVADRPLPKAAPKVSPEKVADATSRTSAPASPVALHEVSPEVSTEIPSEIAPVFQLPDTGSFVIVGERPVNQATGNSRPGGQLDRETRPLTLLGLVLIAVALLLISRPAGEYGELPSANIPDARSITGTEDAFRSGAGRPDAGRPDAGRRSVEGVAAGGVNGERPTLLLENVEALLSRKQPADTATLAFAVEAYRVASMQQGDDIELAKRYRELSSQLARRGGAGEN